MKLIKLNADHYIIVDDSEIKVGDLCCDYEGSPGYNNIKYVVKCLRTASDSYWNNHCKKITHSTQPLEVKITDEGIHLPDWSKVKALSPRVVKELIGEMDVEEKADLWSVDINEVHPADSYIAKKGYMKGYNQALEDNKENKYTEEDMRKAYYQGHKSGLGSENGLTFEYTIQSIQPKTEWDVEFDKNGKLQLK